MIAPVTPSRQSEGRPLSAVEERSPLPRQTYAIVSRPALLIATGWIINEKGEVFLTANPEHITPHCSLQPNAECVHKRSRILDIIGYC